MTWAIPLISIISYLGSPGSSFSAFLARGGRAQLLHGVDQGDDVVDGSRRQNAVAEIENVPRPVADFFQDARALSADVRALAEQHGRIQVALNRDAVREAVERVLDRHSMIDAEHAAAGVE